MPFGRSRRIRTGASTALAIIAFGGILVFAGLILERFPGRFDMTDVGAHSLSGETRAVLAALDRDVRAIAFTSREGDAPATTRDLLENYHVANGRFKYEILDAERNLALAKQYEIPNVGTTVLIAGTKNRNVTEPTEQALTNGLRELMTDKVRKVYFTAGHGEHPLAEGEGGSYNAARSGVEGGNFPVEPITLMTTAVIPDDAAAVVVGGPKKDLLLFEVDLLRDYVRRGGGLIIMLDPGRASGLAGLLAEFGVKLDNDLIVDKLSRLFGGDYSTPVVTQYNRDSFLRGFGVATFFPEARSVQPVSPPPPGVVSVAIASTSGEAWGEIGEDEIAKGEIAFNPERDIPGPVPVAVLATIPIDADDEGAGAKGEPGENEGDAAAAQPAPNQPAPREGRVIVFGDSDFVTDANFGLSGNADLFLNAVEYVARQDNPILIERRQREDSPVSLTETQVIRLLLISFVGAAAVLLAGIVVWRVRRRHR
ncbi:MAG: GldG family protein [Myxococcota bacterium]